MMKMDRTGYVSQIYNLGNYKLHHDYVFGSNNDILVLATEKDSNTKEDKIISVNKDSGKVTEVIDLKKLFKNYYKMTKKAEGSDVNDWMHINSIQLAGDGSIILSSRETSTIIKINNIYDDPEIDYLLL